MAKAGTSSWMDQFVASLQESNANKNSAAMSPAQQGLREALNSVFFPDSSDNQPLVITPEMARNLASPRDFSESQGPVQWTLDKLLRPLYGTSQAVVALGSQIAGQSDNLAEKGIEVNPLKAFWEGFSGENKSTYVDLLAKSDVNPIVAGTLGTVGDLALDPLNFAAAPLTKGLGAAKGVTSAGKTASRVSRAEELSDAYRNQVIADARQAESLNQRVKDLEADTIHRAADKISSKTVAGVSDPVLNLDLSDLTHGAYNSANLAKMASKGNFADDVLKDIVRTGEVPPEAIRPNRATRRATGYKEPEFNLADSIVQAFSGEKPRFYIDEGRVTFSAGRDDIQALLRGETPPVAAVEETQRIAVPKKPITKKTPPAKAANITHTEMSNKARVEALLKKADELDAKMAETQNRAARSNGTLASHQQVEAINSVTAPRDYAKLADATDSKVQNIVETIRKETYGEGYMYGNQTIEQHARSIADIKRLEAVEMANGNFQHIKSSAKGKYWPLQTSQEWEFMDKFMKPTRSKADKSGNKFVTLSGSQQAAVSYLTFIPPSDINRMFAKALDIADVPNMSWAQRRDAIYQAGYEGTKGTPYSWHASDSKIPKYDARKRGSVERKAGALAGTLASHIDDLKALVQTNMKAIAETEVQAGRLAGEIVSDGIVSDFDFTNKGSLSKAVEDLTEPAKAVREAVQGNEVANIAASEKVADTLSKISTRTDVKAAKDVKKSVKQFTENRASFAVNSIRDAGFQRAKFTIDEVADDIRNMLKIEPEDFPSRYWTEVEDALARKRHPIRGALTRFGKHAGKFGVDYENGTSFRLAAQVRYAEDLGQIQKKFSPEVIGNAYDAIISSNGDITSLTNATVQKAAQELLPKVKELFDLDNPLFGAFFRTGAKMSDISREMKAQGFPTEIFTTDIPAEITAQGTAAVNKYVADSWKQLEITDPLSFLDKVHMAFMNISTHQSVAQQMSRHAVTGIPKGAIEEGIKYVQLPEKLNTETRIMQYAPRADSAGNKLYYPDPVVKQITQLERELAISSRPEGKGFFSQKVIKGFVDPLMAIFKPLVTIVNPQHNIRNLLSDVYLNYMDGIKTATPYKKALTVFNDAGHLPDKVQKAINASLRVGEKGAPKYNKVTVKISGPGKDQELTTAQVFRMMEQDGMLPGFHQTEDIFDVGGKSNALWRFAKKVQNNKFVQFGAKTSEIDTHIMRATQYIHRLENGSYKSLREARISASKKTREFHPDTVGLSPEAKKYMRRVFPFYSWFRQILPVTFEVMATHPARITALNKVLHGVQVGMGNDEPGTSIINPYPVTRNIPSFMKDQLGYIGGDFVFNVGTPVEAMADIFNGNIQRNIIGMTNPLAKIPIEAVSGDNLSLGTPITDWSEWADRQIPVVSKAQQISGYSPTGTVSNLLTGGNTGGPGPLDPTRVVAKGEKQAFLNTSLFNFFTGIGTQNINRPTYERIAQREEFNTRSR